jgi:hypothetical protein
MTNNIASLKSKLLTIANKNLLFLPVMKQNIGNQYDPNSKQSTKFISNFSCHAVPADINSYNFLTASNETATKQLAILSSGNKNYIRVDQGFNSNDTDNKVLLSTQFPDLVETQYNVIIDNRFGVIKDPNYTNYQEPTLDDDGMATYSFSSAGNNSYVSEMKAAPVGGATDSELSIIAGSRGTKLQFVIEPASLLKNTNAFSKYGFDITVSSVGTAKCIKTFVKVIGVNTGYSVDVPVIFVYKAS